METLKNQLEKSRKKINENVWIAIFNFVLIILIPTIWFYKDEILPLFSTNRMEGEFNIAIAEFVVLDKDGKAIKSEDGKNISEFIYKSLKNNFQENFDFDVQVWGPS